MWYGGISSCKIVNIQSLCMYAYKVEWEMVCYVKEYVSEYKPAEV
jgi:hypothetical protein